MQKSTFATRSDWPERALRRVVWESPVKSDACGTLNHLTHYVRYRAKVEARKGAGISGCGSAFPESDP
jgi:hypothetical protein